MHINAIIHFSEKNKDKHMPLNNVM